MDPGHAGRAAHKTVTVYNEHIKATQTFSGVPLIYLLTPLGVPNKAHGKGLGLYLVAEGADGYESVYSVAEVNPDVHDATVMVADTLDGKALAGGGPLQLVATGEKTSRPLGAQPGGRPGADGGVIAHPLP